MLRLLSSRIFREVLSEYAVPTFAFEYFGNTNYHG